MYCPKCARQNAPDAKFCEMCGTPLVAPVAEAQPQAADNYSAPAEPAAPPVNQAPQAESPYKTPVGQTVYYGAPAPVATRGSGVAIASLVCSCAAVVFFCVPVFPILLSIAGVICGIVGLKSAGKGMAVAGLIIGILGLLLSILIGGLFYAAIVEFIKYGRSATGFYS